MLDFEPKYEFEIEHTDTFGGEANYCWVNRQKLTYGAYPKERTLVRHAKARLGLTNVKCERETWGDLIVLRPRGMCQIVFISYVL